MQNPEFIRVSGQLYRRRTAPSYPPFIRVAGTLYRLSQHADLDVAVIEAVELAQKILDSLKARFDDDRIVRYLQASHALLGKFSQAIAKGDDAQQADVLQKIWPRITKALEYTAKIIENQLDDTTKKQFLDSLVKPLAAAVNVLSSAKGLDLVGKELGGTSEKVEVDWGEYKVEPKRAHVRQRTLPSLPRVIRDGIYVYRAV